MSRCHHYTYQTLWNVSQEKVIRRKTTEPSGDGENFTIHSTNGVLGSRLLWSSCMSQSNGRSHFDFRTYRIASAITTLKLAPGTDATKQKEFLALLSFSFRLTPFKIGHVRYIISDQNCKFFKFLLSLNSQKRREYKENNTKYRSLNRKPRSHVRILIYRTWPIKRSWKKMSLWIGPIMSTVLLCFVNV